MEFLILPAIIALSFAWMWNRNDKAKKRLKRVRITQGMDEAAFGEWRDHTWKRMGRADLAAALFTLAPLAPFLPFGPVLLLVSGPVALGFAFASNSSGRKADGMAKQLGLKRGVQWLAAKKRIPVEVATEQPINEHPMNKYPIERESYQLPEAFEVWIPEGETLADGYVEIAHSTQYSLVLRNRLDDRCDAEISIDGIVVGIWRIAGKDEIRVERPSHDSGRFTFFVVGSHEAALAGIVPSHQNGLISVTFKPESNATLYSSPTHSQCGVRGTPPMDPSTPSDTLGSSPGPNYSAGATGLTGESGQQFTGVARITHDPSRIFTVHLRLVSRKQDIRPLAPRSTPIPPPI